MKTLKSIFWYITFVLSVIGMMIKYPFHKRKKNVLSKEEYTDYITGTLRDWAAKQMNRTGVTVNVTGMENLPEENVLFVANHQSYFDIGFFLAYLPKNKSYVAKMSVSKIPFVQGYLRDIRCVFLDRGNLRQNAKEITEGIKTLKDGMSMVIFPEGTRSSGNEMLKFKGGSFKLAFKSRVPIVPVTLNGSYKLMTKGSWKIHSPTMDVIIHPPVYTKDLTRDKEVQISSLVHEIIGKAITR